MCCIVLRGHGLRGASNLRIQAARVVLYVSVNDKEETTQEAQTIKKLDKKHQKLLSEPMKPTQAAAQKDATGLPDMEEQA